MKEEDTSFDPESFRNSRETPTYDPADYKNSCMGMLICPHCGNAAQCSDIFDSEGNMLPRGSGSSSGNGGGRGARRQNGLTYIRSEDLSDEKIVAKVLAVRENDTVPKEGQRKFSDVIVKILFKGEPRLFGLKIGTPNYEMLLEDFGDDEKKWVDREFFLYNEKEEFTEKIFPRAEPITKKVSARAAERK